MHPFYIITSLSLTHQHQARNRDAVVEALCELMHSPLPACRSPERPRWDRIDADIIALFETSLRKVVEMHPVPMNVSMVRQPPGPLDSYLSVAFSCTCFQICLAVPVQPPDMLSPGMQVNDAMLKEDRRWLSDRQRLNATFSQFIKRMEALVSCHPHPLRVAAESAGCPGSP